MIRSNLSTKPFYNERSVRMLLLAAALLLTAATAFNVSRVLRYSRSDTRLATQAAHDEARSGDLRQQASRLRASVDPKQIDFASADARQANDLIDRRVFSWTELFNRFEATLPDEVRIVAVRPRAERGEGVVLLINVAARGVDDVSEFMANLEKTGAFRNVRPLEEHISERGELESLIETSYVASAPQPKAAATSGEVKP